MIGFGLCVPVLRGEGLVGDPPPVPVFTLTEETDGQLLISDVAAGLSINVRSPAAHVGSFAVPWQDYAGGIALLMAPTIAGDPVLGEALTIVPGLWVHQGAAPVSSWRWQSRAPEGDFADLPGITASDVLVTPDLQGRELRVVETVLDGTQAVSDPVSVPAAPSVPSFVLTEETDGQIVISAEDGPLSITITEPAIYAGTHIIPADVHGDGVALIVPPVILGVAAPDQDLTAQPGLWVFDGAAPDLVQQWQSQPETGGGWTDLTGATDAVLTLTPDLEGHQIRLRETLGLTQGVSNAVTVSSEGDAGASLIDFAATMPSGTGGITISSVAGGWKMVPAQDNGSPAATGAMSWDISGLGLVTGQTYGIALRLQRDTDEALTGEATRIRTATNKALSGGADDLDVDVLETSDDVTLSLTFTFDGSDTRIGVRTGGWETSQGITATAMSLTEQTT